MIIKRNNYLEVIPEDSYEYEIVQNLANRFCTHKEEPKQNNKNQFQNCFPQIIKTFKYIKKENKFLFYRGHEVLYNNLISLNDVKIIDERVLNPCEINCNVEPRDEEQCNALVALSNNSFEYGILEAAPSSGKTFISLKLASIFKQKTLIIVDMVMLIDQFVSSILKFTDVKEEEIGIINGKRQKIPENYKIIITTVQTIIKRTDIAERLSKEIGYLIVDEVHVAASNTFQTVIPMFRPKYQIGLSGTPRRDDKKEFLILESVGNIKYVADRQKMLQNKSMILPLLRPIFLKSKDVLINKNDNNVEEEFRDVVNEFYLNVKAVDKISKLAEYHYKKGDAQLLVCRESSMVDMYYEKILSNLLGIQDIKGYAENIKQENIKKLMQEIKEITEQARLYGHMTDETKRKIKKEGIAEYKQKKIEKATKKKRKELEKLALKEWYELDEITSNPLFHTVKRLTGNLSREEREKIIDKTNKGEIKIIIATTTMDKALSIDRLNILYLLFSTRERANTIQRIGRVVRSYPNKTQAIVYDVIYDHYMSFYQFYNGKDNCRMEAFKHYTQFYESINLFIKWLKYRFTGFGMTSQELELFNAKLYRNYVLDI